MIEYVWLGFSFLSFRPFLVLKKSEDSEGVGTISKRIELYGKKTKDED